MKKKQRNHPPLGQALRLVNKVTGETRLFRYKSAEYYKFMQYGWMPCSIGEFRRLQMSKGGNNA